MKILVCISKTPDTTSKVAFTNDGKDFNQEGINFIMNPYDEWYALVRAVELKEKNGGSVTVINVGPASNEIIIRKALAIGADDAVRVDVEPISPYHVAVQIAEFAKQSQFDLIFTGKETIDYNGSSVGAMIAELLDWPFVSYASKLEQDGDHFIATREIEGGVEILQLAAPFVLSAAKGLAEQRIPNMQGIMMSKRKPLVVVPPVEVDSRVEILNHVLPPGKKGVKMVQPDEMDELVRMLHEEAKVI